jgi:hypothetical protein
LAIGFRRCRSQPGGREDAYLTSVPAALRRLRDGPGPDAYQSVTKGAIHIRRRVEATSRCELAHPIVDGPPNARELPFDLPSPFTAAIDFLHGTHLFPMPRGFRDPDESRLVSCLRRRICRPAWLVRDRARACAGTCRSSGHCASAPTCRRRRHHPAVVSSKQFRPVRPAANR